MTDPMPETVDRVSITPEAAAVVRRLRATHGPLMFHQSGGCCDGSAPMCYPRGDFIVGDDDVLLGLLDDATPGAPAPVLRPGTSIPDELSPVWISGPQFLLWQHTQLLLDVVPGRGAGFSLEAPEGVRFLTRSRVFDAGEQEWLDACPAPRGRDLPGLVTSPVPDRTTVPERAAVLERSADALVDESVCVGAGRLPGSRRAS